MRRRPCDHCQTRPWEHVWDLTVCANRRRKHAVRLCTPCDIELNALTLHFVRHPEAETLIAAYAQEKGSA